MTEKCYLAKVDEQMRIAAALANPLDLMKENAALKEQVEFHKGYAEGYKESLDEVLDDRNKLKEQVAQLQERIDDDYYDKGETEPTYNELKETIAQLERRDIANSVNTNRHWETIAQQAEALRVKDEALRCGNKCVQKLELAMARLGMSDEDMLIGKETVFDKALAIQSSPDILRERDAHVIANFLEREGKWMTNDAMLQDRDARLVERIACIQADHKGGLGTLPHELMTIADQIRKGEWKS